MQARTHSETGRVNRRLVFGEVLKHRLISRTEISSRVGLKAASVSRITRDLIDAELVAESQIADSEGRRGRRFVQLAPQAEGGYVIGIGINAFRQSVTLADLRNDKIASWEATGLPVEDGESFIRLCAQQAARLVEQHVGDKRRFFGVGIAVAGILDKEQTVLLESAQMGWDRPIDFRAIFSEYLDAPLVIETPSSAINLAESTFGIAQGFQNIITLNCSLVTGLSITFSGPEGEGHTSCVLHDTPYTGEAAATGLVSQFRTLEEALSGRSLVADRLGASADSLNSDAEWGAALVDLVGRANAGDNGEAEALKDLGAGYARVLALLFAVVNPELVILAGPLAGSSDFVAGMRRQIELQMPKRMRAIEVAASSMTHIGAARWLSIRENLIQRDIGIEQFLSEG